MPIDSPLETEIENPISTEAEADGWHVRKTAWRGRVGCPDRVFMKAGRTVWIEFKRPKGGVRKGIQITEGRRIREAGCEFYFCATLEEGRRILGLPSHG